MKSRELSLSRRKLLAGSITGGLVGFGWLRRQETKGVLKTTPDVRKHTFSIMSGKNIQINIYDTENETEEDSSGDSFVTVHTIGDNADDSIESKPVFSVVDEKTGTNVLPPRSMDYIPDVAFTDDQSGGEYSLYFTKPAGKQYEIHIESGSTPFLYDDSNQDQPRETIEQAISSVDDFSFTNDANMIYTTPAKLGILKKQVEDTDLPKEEYQNNMNLIEEKWMEYYQYIAGIAAKNYAIETRWKISDILIELIWAKVPYGRPSVLYSSFRDRIYDMIQNDSEIVIESVTQRDSVSKWAVDLALEASGEVYVGENISLNFSVPAEADIQIERDGYHTNARNRFFEFITDILTYQSITPD